MSDEQNPLFQIEVDRDNLYREEVVTDLKVATIRKLVPIRPDGSPDDARPALYSAETQLMSQMGPVPVHAPIEASSLEEAMDKFPEAVKQAVDRLMQEAREIQQREASRIVVPTAVPRGVGGGGQGGGFGGPGGPGGPKIIS